MAGVTDYKSAAGSCQGGAQKSQFWLHVGSVSLTLTFAFSHFGLFAFVIITIHNSLPQGTHPSAWLLNWSTFIQLTEIIWPSPPVNGCTKEEISTPGTILQDKGPFYFTSSPLPLCFREEPGIQTKIRWLFWDISPPSSLSASFLSKVVFLASTPVSDFTGLSCGEQSELRLGNRDVLCCWHTPGPRATQAAPAGGPLLFRPLHRALLHHAHARGAQRRSSLPPASVPTCALSALPQYTSSCSPGPPRPFGMGARTHSCTDAPLSCTSHSTADPSARAAVGLTFSTAQSPHSGLPWWASG